ncbi:amidohydrolase [Reichenbachiella sp.]|uniref:amidohydrolase n=1 Tax=Reichenbachiella sp. TaxID=2184521 RepID=UPI003299E2E2
MKLITLSILMILSSCKDDAIQPGPSVEEAYVNGKIYTVNDNQLWAEAMLVKKGVIVAIGTNEEIQQEATSSATTIDLENRMVMPGIHDVHTHPLEAGTRNVHFTLEAVETNPENYASEIRNAVRQNSNSEWVVGAGFETYIFYSEDVRSPLAILNDISTTKAIAILALSGHTVWANSKALALAGIDADSPDPAGGVIMKDENGQPNGLLMDNAGDLLLELAFATFENREDNDYFGLLEYGLPELASNGITSTCDARTFWKRNQHLTWKRVEENNQLTARVNLGLWVYPEEEDASQISTLQSLFSNDPNSLLKINQIKLYSDGITTNTTAAMHDNYLVDIFNHPTNNGLNYISQDRIAQYISALEPIGFDFHMHTIGDRGVTEALNAIEQVGTGSGRHRLTHVEYVSPTDYDRFSQLNVTADAQVAGDYTNPDSWHASDALVNPSLNDNFIPIKSIKNAKARITLSSDWDVSTLNPFVGMQNAVTRAPQELALSDAIKAYTINGAYVMRQEDQVGSLEVGKEADFIVLDQNIIDIQPNRISKTRVLETYLRGKLIYQQ